MNQNIYLCSELEPILFGSCIASKLGLENSELVNVSFPRFSNHFSISKSQSNANFRVPFYHSQICPFKELEKIMESPVNFSKKVPVLSSIIIRSLDQKVLITRKSEFMSIHGKSWVFPYGKVKAKESLQKAALKALRDDTGINILEISEGFLFNNVKVTIQPVCVFESVFPKNIEFGMPRNQGIVVFFQANLPVLAKEIQAKCFDTDFLMWVHKEEWENAQNGVFSKVQVEGRESEVFSSAIQGISPNFMGEGVSEGHFIALNLVFSIDMNI